MAAPEGIVWGSTVGDYGRIGIFTEVVTTNTTVDIGVQIWFWSKYSVSDSSNTLYFDNLASSGKAETSRGSVSISTSSDSGGWSSSNQKKLKSYAYSYNRGTSASTRYLYAKLTGIDRVGGTMSVSKTVSVPKLASYTVSYNANGGSGAPSSQTKYYGKSLTLSSTKPTRTGYTFQGWGTSASDTSVNYKAGASYTSNSAITLYAIWKKNTYTVSYNANGGSGAPSSQTKTYGETLTLSSTKPTRTGYDFKGWGTSASDTSVNYAAGASYTSNSAITLYAIWSIKTYTVSYNANGGSGAPSSQTKTHGTTLTLSSTKPTRTGYVFQGWGTSASDTSVDYAAGASYTSNSAITLYAIWKINTYTITYNANGGSLGNVSKQTKNYGETIALTGNTAETRPTRSGYTFKGWGTSSSATTVTYIAGASYTSNADITLYAVWSSSYDKPKITSFTAKRCDSGGIASDKGTYVNVTYKCECSLAISSIIIKWKLSTENSYPSSNSKTLDPTSTIASGTEIVGGGKIDVNNTYDVCIVVTDSGGNASKVLSVPGGIFTFDMLGGGKGVAFGKSAEFEDTADFNFVARLRKHILMELDKAIVAISPDGVEKSVFQGQNESGNTIIGRGNYDAKSGGTNIYGHTIQLGISDTASGSYTWAPYRRKGHVSSNITIRTSGYVTNSGKDVTFWLPVSVPIVGEPQVSVSSNNGLVLRQNEQYTHGSGANTYVNPDTYEVSYYAMHGIRITAKFTKEQSVNVTNNDAIGIYWNGTITFS